MYDLNDLRAWVLIAVWVSDPIEGIRLVAALLLAWFHGCVGLHFWLKLKPWYAAGWAPWLFTVALLWPAFSLAGVAAGLREVAILLEQPAWAEAVAAEINIPAPRAWPGRWAPSAHRIGAWTQYWWRSSSRGWRATCSRGARARSPSRPASASSKPAVILASPTPRGAAGAGAVPPVGYGSLTAWSTCRRRARKRSASSSGSALPTTSVSRARCPDHDISVTPLLAATPQPADGHRRSAYLQGSEREIAILFANMRSFTQFPEKKLPYDVVFVLNQYFRAIGAPIERAGGQLDKFIGDGVMALFGVRGGIKRGCREALGGAREMPLSLAELNTNLKDDLPEPMRIGIGIHTGAVVVGEMGYAAARSVTAIGDQRCGQHREPAGDQQ